MTNDNQADDAVATTPAIAQTTSPNDCQPTTPNFLRGGPSTIRQGIALRGVGFGSRGLELRLDGATEHHAAQVLLYAWLSCRESGERVFRYVGSVRLPAARALAAAVGDALAALEELTPPPAGAASVPHAAPRTAGQARRNAVEPVRVPGQPPPSWVSVAGGARKAEV